MTAESTSAIVPVAENVTDVPIRELEAQWGISRNTLIRRAKGLGVKLIRIGSNRTVWPGSEIWKGNELAEQLASGMTVEESPLWIAVDNSRSDSDQTSISRTKKDSNGALLAFLEQKWPEIGIKLAQTDPLETIRRIEAVADSPVPLTQQEMAQVLGIAEMRPWMHGTFPRPGYRLKRIEHPQTTPKGQPAQSKIFWRLIAA